MSDIIRSSGDSSCCHLLVVVDSLACGGAEAMAVQLALALDPAHVRPVAVCLLEAGVWADRLAGRSIPVHERQRGYKYDMRTVGRLSRLAKHYAPACLLTVGTGSSRMFYSALAGWWTGTPVVVWSHSFPMMGHPRRFDWPNRRLYGCVDAFVALGARHREALIALEGVPAERLTVIRNGIEPDRFCGDDQRVAVRCAMKADGDDVVVGIVANLRPDKRHDMFIEAAAKVRSVRGRARFVIIGDGTERAAVEDMVAGHDPDGTFLQMLGGRDDVATVMQGLDIVCLTSEEECLSIAMLEAMAAGKAFVAPRLGSLDESLIDGVTGRFFDPRTADALASVLIELIDDAEQRRSLGQQARAKVREEFTVARMAREFESLVCSLCRRQPADGPRSF